MGNILRKSTPIRSPISPLMFRAISVRTRLLLQPGCYDLSQCVYGMSGVANPTH